MHKNVLITLTADHVNILTVEQISIKVKLKTILLR